MCHIKHAIQKNRILFAECFIYESIFKTNQIGEILIEYIDSSISGTCAHHALSITLPKKKLEYWCTCDTNHSPSPPGLLSSVPPSKNDVAHLIGRCVIFKDLVKSFFKRNLLFSIQGDSDIPAGKVSFEVDLRFCMYLSQEMQTDMHCIQPCSTMNFIFPLILLNCPISKNDWMVRIPFLL